MSPIPTSGWMTSNFSREECGEIKSDINFYANDAFRLTRFTDQFQRSALPALYTGMMAHRAARGQRLNLAAISQSFKLSIMLVWYLQHLLQSGASFLFMHFGLEQKQRGAWAAWESAYSQ